MTTYRWQNKIAEFYECVRLLSWTGILFSAIFLVSYLKGTEYSVKFAVIYYLAGTVFFAWGNKKDIRSFVYEKPPSVFLFFRSLNASMPNRFYLSYIFTVLFWGLYFIHQELPIHISYERLVYSLPLFVTLLALAQAIPVQRRVLFSLENKEKIVFGDQLYHKSASQDQEAITDFYQERIMPFFPMAIMFFSFSVRLPQRWIMYLMSMFFCLLVLLTSLLNEIALQMLFTQSQLLFDSNDAFARVLRGIESNWLPLHYAIRLASWGIYLAYACIVAIVLFFVFFSG